MALKQRNSSSSSSSSSPAAVISSPYDPWEPKSHILDELRTSAPYQSYTGEKQTTTLYAFPNHLIHIADRISNFLGTTTNTNTTGNQPPKSRTRSEEREQDNDSELGNVPEERRRLGSGLILHCACNIGIDTLRDIPDFTTISSLKSRLDSMDIPRDKRAIYGMLKNIYSSFVVSISDLSGSGAEKRNIHLTRPLRGKLDDFSALSGLNLSSTVVLACMIAFSVPSIAVSAEDHKSRIVDLGYPGGIEVVKESINAFSLQLKVRRKLLENLLRIIEEDILEG